MPERRAKVVVVGSGRMGQIRSSLLFANPRFELAGVVDVNFDGAANLAQSFRTRPYENIEEAVLDNKGDLDGVVVCSPTFTHEDVVTNAASYGLDVFTEKPVDETADKIRHLFNVVEEANIQLCCGFQRRFDNSYVSATKSVHTGQIGKPVSASLFFADHPCPPKEFLLNGGNIFMDLSAHDVDYIMHTLQDHVVSVYATGTSSTEELEAAGVHDNATMMMRFSKGTVVTLFMSRSATYGYDQRCEIFGEEGLVSVGNEHKHSTTLSNQAGIHQSNLKYSFPQRFHQAFGTELDAFADTVLLKEKWPVTAENCIMVQKVADAADISCKSGQVVEIDYSDMVLDEQDVEPPAVAVGW